MRFYRVQKHCILAVEGNNRWGWLEGRYNEWIHCGTSPTWAGDPTPDQEIMPLEVLVITGTTGPKVEENHERE